MDSCTARRIMTAIVIIMIALAGAAYLFPDTPFGAMLPGISGR